MQIDLPSSFNGCSSLCLGLMAAALVLVNTISELVLEVSCLTALLNLARFAAEFSFAVVEFPHFQRRLLFS